MCPSFSRWRARAACRGAARVLGVGHVTVGRRIALFEKPECHVAQSHPGRFYCHLGGLRWGDHSQGAGLPSGRACHCNAARRTSSTCAPSAPRRVFPSAPGKTPIRPTVAAHAGRGRPAQIPAARARGGQVHRSAVRIFPINDLSPLEHQAEAETPGAQQSRLLYPLSCRL